MRIFEDRLSKLAYRRLFSKIHMARNFHKQKESRVAAVLRMRALNSYINLDFYFKHLLGHREYYERESIKHIRI